MLTALTVAGTAATYRLMLAYLNTAPAGTLRARTAAVLGGGGPGPK